MITITDDGKLKTSEIIKNIKKKFDIHLYCQIEQLDKDFPPVKTERKFKYLQEADPENANKSANQLDQSKQITLRERLLFELEYFNKEGKHLDEENVTLCAGSRRSVGGVPYVSWSPGDREVHVLWCDPGDHGGSLRSRSAVS